MTTTATIDETELVRLRAENVRLVAERDAALAARAALEQKNAKLEHEVAELRRQLFGQKSEKDAQAKEGAAKPSEDARPEELAGKRPVLPAPPGASEAPAKDASKPKGRKKKGHGWGKISKDLPRKRVPLEPDEQDLTCDTCGKRRTSICSPDVTERLDCEPRSVFVVEYVRPRYRCPVCLGGVVIAPLPKAPLHPKTRGRMEAGALAQFVVAKFNDHIPLDRQRKILAREGARLSRSTIGDCVRRTAALVRPVAGAVLRDLLSRPVVGFDATGLRVLGMDAEGSEAARRMACVWAYRGLPGEIFFTITRSTAKAEENGPLSLLADFEGHVQADAANTFDDLFKDGKRLEVGCCVHERRGYFKAKKSSPREAAFALATFKKVYEIEARVRDASPEVRLAARQTETKPILDAFDEWIDKIVASGALVPGTPLAKAIGYSRNHRVALRRFLDDPRLSPDNNAVERALRPVAVGRKNYLFAGSEVAADDAATLYTLVASCRDLGVDPWQYLRDVIQRRAADPSAPAAELTPHTWWAARQAEKASTTT